MRMAYLPLSICILAPAWAGGGKHPAKPKPLLLATSGSDSSPSEIALDPELVDNLLADLFQGLKGESKPRLRGGVHGSFSAPHQDEWLLFGYLPAGLSTAEGFGYFRNGIYRNGRLEPLGDEVFFGPETAHLEAADLDGDGLDEVLVTAPHMTHGIEETYFEVIQFRKGGVEATQFFLLSESNDSGTYEARGKVWYLGGPPDQKASFRYRGVERELRKDGNWGAWHPIKEGPP
jgi:hypothetical protein